MMRMRHKVLGNVKRFNLVKNENRKTNASVDIWFKLR